ncbi:MAG: hypothetical protein RMK52_09045 [Chitinophagales bacterium]|nr:hypothetical protein [Chitinophagales bacterium]MDW8394374.1 hypothetical protein [Chitinophagales bacterium]
MKRLVNVAGVLLLFAGGIPLLMHSAHYMQLTPYGRGYLWGKFLMLAAGIVLLIVSWRSRRAPSG